MFVIYRKSAKKEGALATEILDKISSFFNRNLVPYETVHIGRSAAKTSRSLKHIDASKTIGITYGIPKYCRRDYGGTNAIFDHHAVHENLLVIERGFIKRDIYHSIGWNNMNGYAFFNNAKSPSDRWDKLGVDLKPWRTDGKKILITGQVPWDGNVQNLYTEEENKNWSSVVNAYLGWLNNLYKTLDGLGYGKNIIFRKHPAISGENSSLDIESRILIPREKWSSGLTLEEDLEDAKVLVTYNSNSAVNSVINGVPVVVFDQGSMAWPVAGKLIKNVKRVRTPKRVQWAYNLAYTQWSLEEIGNGEFLEHLRRDR